MATPKKKRLFDLNTKEISCVPEGANSKRWLVLKNKGGAMAGENAATEVRKLIEKGHDPAIMKAVAGVLAKHGAVKAAPPEPVAPAPVEGAETGELGPQEQAAVNAVVRILMPFKEKLNPAMMHEVLDAAGFKVTGEAEPGEAAENAAGEGADATPATVENAAPSATDEEEQEDEDNAEDGKKEAAFEGEPAKVEGVEKAHLDEAMTEGNKAYGAHLEKMGYEKYPTAQMAMKNKDGEPVEKGKGEHVSKSATATAANPSRVDPKAREEANALFEANRELVKKTAALEKDIADMKAEGRKREIVQKSASFAHVNLPQTEIVAMLETADKAGAEAYERVCKNFDALNEQGKSSKVFAEFGSSAGDTRSGAANAYSKIEALASGLVQKSATRLTQAEAIDQVLQTPEGQRLYKEHQAGRKDGI